MRILDVSIGNECARSERRLKVAHARRACYSRMTQSTLFDLEMAQRTLRFYEFDRVPAPTFP